MKEVSHSVKLTNKEYLDEPPQPRAEDPIPRVSSARRQRGVRYFPAELPAAGTEVDILFVQVAPLPEEASEILETGHGMQIPRQAGIGVGPAAQILRSTVNRFNGLHDSRVGFISMVPWLLPKTRRFRPSKEEIEKCTPWLQDQVAAIKPKVVVAMGMPAFKALCPVKVSHDDARYGWFSTHDGTPLYLSFQYHQLLTQPWMEDTLITDMKEVDRFLKTSDRQPHGDINYEVIDTEAQLESLVAKWREGNFKSFSVDCEWGRGGTHLTADLRSIQFSWSDTEAAYLRFYDHTGQRHLGAAVAFDEYSNEVLVTDYKAVGRILNTWFDEPGTEFIGHHLTADTPWMDVVLGIDVRGKCMFDSEYALQTVDEYAPRGLESIALRFTDLGRYDMDLVMWKKANPGATKEGYEFVPDEILIPYAVKDVIVVWRSRAPLERRMASDDVLNYYRSILNPFVTDVFHDFVVEGLPVNMELFQAVRTFMNWSYRVLMEDFMDAVARQADTIAAEKLGLAPSHATSMRLALQDLGEEVAAARAAPLFRPENEGDTLGEQPWFQHWITVTSFNIRSSPAMRRWLFGVCGFTPIKTTKGGAEGMPSMLWEKALELPEKIFKTLNPATDKETLEILEKDDKTGLITRLLAVSNVGNQCKGFLKEGEVDPATGEVVEEQGLAKFIVDHGNGDFRIHGQFSLTETGRPSSWNPNILNLSSYHNKGVEAGLIRILNERPDLEIPPECAILLGTRQEIEGKVEAAFAEYLANRKEGDKEQTQEGVRKGVMKKLVKEQIPTVRSVICAMPGRCFVESDYKTAEIRGLAFIFGDRSLIKLMTEPDPSFGVTKGGAKVRLYYDKDSGIPEAAQDPQWIMKVVEEDKPVVTVTEDDLKRDKEGNLVHPSYDLHWSLAELVYQKPREILSDKKDRGAAKVANFSCIPDSLVLTDSGIKQATLISVDDRVWDGTEFVHHEGLTYQGIRLTVEFRGLRATPEHVVFTEDGCGMRLLEAALSNTPIEVGASNLDAEGCDSGKGGRASEGESGRGCVEVSAPGGKDAVAPLPGDGATLRGGHPRQCDKLQVSRHPDEDRVGTGIRGLGAAELAGGDLQGERLRPDRQRRSLRADESSVGVEVGEPGQHPPVVQLDPGEGGEVQKDAPGNPVRRKDSLEPDPAGEDARPDPASLRGRGEAPDQGGEAGEFQDGLRPPALSGESGSEILGEADLQAVPAGAHGRPDPGAARGTAEAVVEGGAAGESQGVGGGLLTQVHAGTRGDARNDGSGDRRPVGLYGGEAGEIPQVLDLVVTDSGVLKYDNSIPRPPVVAKALKSFTERSGDLGHLVKPYLEQAQFPAALDIARLEAAGLHPRLDLVFDISDCGPRNRFMVLAPDPGSVVGFPQHERGRESIQTGTSEEAGEESHTGVLPEGDPESRVELQPGCGNELRREGDHPRGVPEGPPVTPGFRQVIVSNCAYGAVASTIERRIEAVTGIKPEEGTGEALLAALEKRQPDVFRGLEEVAKMPERGERLVAASGRVRRFPVHSGSLSGVSWRVRNSYLRAMGNEARNFYPQESVASTLARACRWLNAWYRSEGLSARSVIGLYDSVLTYCDESERHICAEAHQAFMCDINFWKYGRRYMNYPIDTDLVERWSYKPGKELKARLESRDYAPFDPVREKEILDRLHGRVESIFAAQPWVRKNLNRAEIAA